jgi:RNA polymerase sigma factor (sigma-70 family)
LIGRVDGGGNGQSLRDLLNGYCDYVWRLAERFGKKRVWPADDVTEAQSDAIFTLIRASKRFQPNRVGHNGRPCGFRTFLHRLVTDRLKDFAKKRRHYLRRFGVSLDAGHAADHQSDCDCRRCRQLAVALASNESNSADLAERNERLELLRVAIPKLKPIYRQVAELDAAGKSVDEIAAELQITKACALKRRTKARAELRRLMTT